ncbi:MAG TPA: hypothetical protein VFQ54_01590 [Thermomicrobiales bacterium]|nr:hypothetical protein [Thermomicrobiales bacterium]
MSGSSLVEAIARAGFEAAEREIEYRAKQSGGYRHARIWEEASELDRIWWRYVVDKGAQSPQDIFERRMEGAYGVKPWMKKSDRERIVWERISNAMNAARRRASIDAMAAD